MRPTLGISQEHSRNTSGVQATHCYSGGLCVLASVGALPLPNAKGEYAKTVRIPGFKCLRSLARAKLSDVLGSDFYFGNHRCGQRNVSEPLGHGLTLGGAPLNKLSQDLRLLGVLLPVK